MAGKLLRLIFPQSFELISDLAVVTLFGPINNTEVVYTKRNKVYDTDTDTTSTKKTVN